MSPIVWVIVAAAVFFLAVFAVVMVSGTRLTGKQIAEDPDARKGVDPDKRDEDFPLDADY